MKLSRTLRLSKETLRHLSDDALRFARGGILPDSNADMTACATNCCPTTSTGSAATHPTGGPKTLTFGG